MNKVEFTIFSKCHEQCFSLAKSKSYKLVSGSNTKNV
jgi:hypothetical protein